jgi:hypothetical protein
VREGVRVGAPVLYVLLLGRVHRGVEADVATAVVVVGGTVCVHIAIWVLTPPLARAAQDVCRDAIHPFV